jgi:anaerobic magnesium-protoporphyrin IX monomethyl ester cyclase
MPDILVTHSYLLRLDPKQWKLQQPYPPLGTLYAAAVLRTAGFGVRFHDMQFAYGGADLGPELEKSHPGIVVIYDDGFNYLTKMCLTNMRRAAFEMIGLAKEKNARVIVCSSDATDHFADYLDAGADFVIMGEGEQTLLELVQALNKGSDHSIIKGLAMRVGAGIHKTAARPVMRDLDALAMPAWDLLNIIPYENAWRQNHGYFSINMATTRGCPFKCNWCAKPIYGNRYHVRSPQKVVVELQWIRELFPVDHIWFCDDIFGLKPGWVEDYATELNKAGIHLPFKIQSRADLLVQPRYVTALAAAGCATVWMGAESGAQSILDAMDKGITVEQIGEATILLRDNGIAPCFFIQFGYLGETQENIRATIKMINTLQPAEIGISVSYPLPGTKFYERVRAELKQKSNWTDSDDLALLFHNGHSAAYYRQLHRYVHRQYGVRRAWKQVTEAVRRPSFARFGMLRKLASLVVQAPLLCVNRIRLARLQKSS